MKATLEIIMFTEDIITASGGLIDGGEGGETGDIIIPEPVSQNIDING